MSDVDLAIETFGAATGENRIDPLLRGSMLHFPDYGQLVMTGDIHGHTRNFAKLQKYCDLEHTPVRHVILHELIHTPPESLESVDTSHLMMLEAAEWKCRYPEQVHFLQSNHELAQFTSHDIFKGGRSMLQDFKYGLMQAYGDRSEEVLEVVLEFIRSFPMAGRTPNGVFLSHSLPNAFDWPRFDQTMLDRQPTPQDLAHSGSAYLLVWGRQHPPEYLDRIAEELGVSLFIVGHQPQEQGFDVLGDRLIILASDHNHGVFLPFDLKKQYTVAELVSLIRPFAGVA